MKTLIKTLIVAGAVMALATASMAQAAGPRGGALSIIIGGQGIPLYKLACVIPTKPS